MRDVSEGHHPPPSPARAALVDLTISLYGQDALLGPTPPGPDECPTTCHHCHDQTLVERVQAVGE